MCRIWAGHVGIFALRFRWWFGETNSATAGPGHPRRVSEWLCSGYRHEFDQPRVSTSYGRPGTKKGGPHEPASPDLLVGLVGQENPKAARWPGQSIGMRVARSSFSAVSERGCCP